MNHIEKSKELLLSPEEYVLVGGSILDIHGIRESNDIDVVVSQEAFQKLKERGWPLDEVFKEKWGRARLKHDVFEVLEDLYFEKIDYHLSFEMLREFSVKIDGVHTQPLSILLLAKLNCGRMKDLNDVKLIEQYFNK